jgi:ArsR family transcriptional regulator, lead/cadmium/zinc/bismuth-responsive transcriptional repressor
MVNDPEVSLTCEHPPRQDGPARKKPSEATFERAAAIFRAAGDAPRLRLMELLSTGEWCVSELAAETKAGMSTVSQQLKVLRSERLITRKRVGKHIYYRLSDDHIVALLRGALEHAEEPHDAETSD